MGSRLRWAVVVAAVALPAAAFAESGRFQQPGMQIVGTDAGGLNGGRISSHLEASMDAYRHRNPKGAASEIRQVVDAIRPEVERASEDSKDLLRSSMNELDRLASQLDRNGVKSEKELATAFSRVEKNLAQFYQNGAKDSLARKEFKAAGRELKLAADQLEHSAKWTGEKLDSESEKAIRDARNVSGKLLRGADWVPRDVERAVNELGKEVASG